MDKAYPEKRRCALSLKKMRFKKSQVTLFVVMGFLLIIATATLYFIISEQKEEQTEAQRDLQEDMETRSKTLKNTVQDCLSFAAEDVIMLASRQGGYIHPEIKYETVVIDDYHIPVYTDCGTAAFPDIYEIKRDMEITIENEFRKCFAVSEKPIEFQNLDYDGLDIDADVIMNDEDTSVNLYFNIRTDQIQRSQLENKFRVNVDVPFRYMVENSIFLLNLSTTSIAHMKMAERTGLDINVICSELPLKEVNLYIKRVKGERNGTFIPEVRPNNETYLDIIQFVDYTQPYKNDRGYVFQFLVNRMNFAEETGCINEIDSDMDSIPDEIDNCEYTNTTIVDRFGCSCKQRNCTDGKKCKSYKNQPYCLDEYEQEKYRYSYDEIRLADTDFDNATHFRYDIEVFDCIYDKATCPYERVCGGQRYKDARDEWKDECRVGEIQIESQYRADSFKLITSTNRTNVSFSSHNPHIKIAQPLYDYETWFDVPPYCWTPWIYEFADANWIWDVSPNMSGLNTISDEVHFKEEVYLDTDAELKSANLLVTVDGNLVVEINDVPIFNTPSMYAGANCLSDKTKTVDMLPFLGPGKNDIVFKVYRDQGRPGGIMYRMEIEENLDTEYRCCRSAAREHKPWAYHGTLFTWSLARMQEDCKHQSPGKEPQHYPMIECWHGACSETACSHDPSYDPSAIYGPYLSVAKCYVLEMELCSSDGRYPLDHLFFIGPYDDKDDNGDCPVIKKSALDFWNNSPSINGPLGVGMDVDSFRNEFEDLVNHVQIKDRYLSTMGENKLGEARSKIGAFTSSASSADPVVSSMVSQFYQEAAQQLDVLNMQIVDLEMKFNELDTSHLTNENLNNKDALEQFLIVDSVNSLTDSLQKVNTQAVPFIEDDLLELIELLNSTDWAPLSNEIANGDPDTAVDMMNSPPYFDVRIKISQVKEKAAGLKDDYGNAAQNLDRYNTKMNE